MAKDAFKVRKHIDAAIKYAAFFHVKWKTSWDMDQITEDMEQKHK